MVTKGHTVVKKKGLNETCQKFAYFAWNTSNFPISLFFILRS